MAFKNLLVQLDNHRNSASRLDIALSLARKSGGRILGLYGLGLPDLPKVPYVVAEAAYPVKDAARELYERQRDAAFDEATQCEATFVAATRHAGISADWELSPQKPKELIDTLIQRARYADLAILGQADPDHPLFDTFANLPETVMLGAGRPVVIVPYAIRANTIGKRILVAWNGTREAARAVGDALPLLQAAEAVTVFTVSSEGEPSPAQPAQELARQLASHGIHAKVAHQPARDSDAGDLILSRADDLGCDLLVMGGYGHSRTREFILSGATRIVLQSMTLPVLMSH